MLTGREPGGRCWAAPMSTFVNVWRGAGAEQITRYPPWYPRNEQLQQAVPWPGSRSASRTIVTQSECATLRRCAARYALLVRILALALRQFAPVVRTHVRNPIARTFRANLGDLPVIKSYGFQVEVSTVVSTVLQCFLLATCRFAKTTP